MKEHLGAFAAHDLAHLEDWLGVTSELYVDVYWHRTAGSGVNHVISSLSDLKKIIVKLPGRLTAITIFRSQPYALRGQVDDDFIAQAQQLIKDGQYFEIVDKGILLDVDGRLPGSSAIINDGRSHDELRAQLAAMRGQDVAVGTDPFDYPVDFFKRPEEAFDLLVTRDLSVKKNWSSYPPYDQNPEKYQPLVIAWNE